MDQLFFFMDQLFFPRTSSFFHLDRLFNFFCCCCLKIYENNMALILHSITKKLHVCDFTESPGESQRDFYKNKDVK